MGVLLAVSEGRKTTESEGWASQSLLGCAPSYDMPYPLSGHCSQDQEEAGRAPGQPDEVDNWSGSLVHRQGGSWAGLVVCVGPYPGVR